MKKMIAVILMVTSGTLYASAPMKLTDDDYYNCAAMVARRTDLSGSDYKFSCPDNSSVDGRDGELCQTFQYQFDELMAFQRGYESSILGHETVMYRWKQKGRALCWKLAAQGKRPKFPTE